MRGYGPRVTDTALPVPDVDFFDLASTFTDEERALQRDVRAFMLAEVAPVADEHWMRGEFYRDVLPSFRRLRVGERLWEPDGTRDPAKVLGGYLVGMEMARVDPSMATFFGVHNGLASLSIAHCGSAEQRAEWLPRMRTLDAIGAFGLTEPDVGSGAARGLTTTARRDGDTWVLEGRKKWIGNATFADVVVVWARDVADDDVKGFLVRPDNPGYAVERIEGKLALRSVENGLITLTSCRVPESDRLAGADSFRATADVLRATRAGVAWSALGCAMGAYERAVAYTQTREQFGRPIASFQLVQRHLVEMVGAITATQTLVLRLAQLQREGRMRDEQASLAKRFAAARCRETVAHAREVLGGNGILLEHGVARFFCDAEALYSYEGTDEINALIVGRALTGIAAFV